MRTYGHAADLLTQLFAEARRLEHLGAEVEVFADLAFKANVLQLGSFDWYEPAQGVVVILDATGERCGALGAAGSSYPEEIVQKIIDLDSANE